MSKQGESIKNCPFCGSSVSVERVPLEHYKGCVIFEIKCLNCGCERTLIQNDSVYRTEEEARANAIAQWNERFFSAAVPHEMTAREFLVAYKRMCASFPETDCSKCPMYTPYKDCTDNPCDWDIDKILPAVGQWAREHPERSEE